MKQYSGFASAGLTLAALAALTCLPGCTPAQSEPLEVTYYYLPG